MNEQESREVLEAWKDDFNGDPDGCSSYYWKDGEYWADCIRRRRETGRGRLAVSDERAEKCPDCGSEDRTYRELEDTEDGVLHGCPGAFHAKFGGTA